LACQKRAEISQGGATLIEAGRTNPGVMELIQRMQDSQVFLRMVTVELSRLAELAPDIAVELRHVAQQLEAEADDLARRNTE
jgi:uncharacterized protein (UPF0210 family)